jgi:hypothetical protein
VCNARAGGIQNADSIVLEFLSRSVDSAGGPLERDAVFADHDVAEGGADVAVCRPVAGPEFAGLCFAVDWCGNDWSSDFAELRKSDLLPHPLPAR